MKSLGLKISLIVTVMIALLIGIIFWIVSVRSTGLLNDLTDKESKAANAAFGKALVDLQNEAQIRAMMIATDPAIDDYVINHDSAGLKASLNNYNDGFDVITVVDADGYVLARVHSDQVGDNVLSQDSVSVALSTGQGINKIEKGSVAGFSTRGSSAIRDIDGSIIGAVVCGHDLSEPRYMDAIKARSNCEVTLFDGDTRVNTTLVDEKGNRDIGTKAPREVSDSVLKRQENYPLQTVLSGVNYAAYYSPLVVDGTTVGMLFSGISIDQALADRQEMMNWVLYTAVIAGILCAGIVFFFSLFSVSKPLKKIGILARKIKTGDIGISSSENVTLNIHSADEVGILSQELNEAYTQLRGYIGEIRERMQGLSDGDLVTESTYNFQGDFILIKDAINDIIRSFNNLMTKVGGSAVQVASGSKQIADGAQSLAQGSTEQASSIEELSSSIGEVKDKTSQNADVARKAADLSRAIKDNAEMGNAQMEQMMQAVHEINEASNQISAVIKVIDDIAFQTNILALNAAVEAARAGQHGKGFAVVAEEVRNLAAKSADAARDTGGLIENSIEKANLGLDIANKTSASLSEIVEGIKQSYAIVSEIAQSSDEQAVAITQINTGIDQVAQVVQLNSATAEESAAASEEMSGQSTMLQQMMAHFKVG